MKIARIPFPNKGLDLPENNSPPASQFPLGLWMLLAVVLDILCSAAAGDELGFSRWAAWAQHLLDYDYARPIWDHPPVFIHWLWLIAHIENLLGLAPGDDSFFRFLVVTPLIVCHAALLYLLDAWLRTVNTRHRDVPRLMALAAFNPVLLVNGPMSGRVDLLALLPAVLAFALLLHAWERGRAEGSKPDHNAAGLAWVFPLMTFAMLTNPSAAGLIPAMVPLLWRQRSRALYAGLLLSIPLAAVIVLPFAMMGGLDGVMGIDALHSPSSLGLALYAAWALLLVVAGVRAPSSARHWSIAILGTIGWCLLLWSVERTTALVTPVVIVALASVTRDHRYLAPTLVLSLCVFDLLIRMEGPAPFIFATIALILAAIPWVTDGTRIAPFARRIQGMPLTLWLASTVAIWGVALIIHVRYADDLATARLDAYIAQGWMDATHATGRRAVQDWGELQIDRSVESRALTVAGHRYANGFGTHARSLITIPIPAHATDFTAFVGLDDEAPGGRVRFEVRVDGVTAWSGGDMTNGITPEPVAIDLRGKRRLELVVDPLGNNDSDHADWLEPRFLFESVTTQTAR